MAEELIKVADVYLVKNEDNFTGCNVGFNESVKNKRGAALVIDMLRQSMNSSAWTTMTVMAVRDQDAQTDEGTADGRNSAPPPDEDPE